MALYTRKQAELAALREEVKAIRARAEGGDGEAMYVLGQWYYHGSKGLAMDFKQAFGWWQRGDDLGHVPCTAELRICYTNGVGVEQDEAYALCLYGIAAKGGSEVGCYYLAQCLAKGWNVQRKNPRAATRWFRAMESATVRDAPDCVRDKAAKWLRAASMRWTRDICLYARGAQVVQRAGHPPGQASEYKW